MPNDFWMKNAIRLTKIRPGLHCRGFYSILNNAVVLNDVVTGNNRGYFTFCGFEKD
jgi:hypothetical protein